jgi:predicted transcriptional regulator
MQATTIRCDASVLHQLDALAEARNRSRTWIINQALTEYIAREEKREKFKEHVLKSWRQYQETGLHVIDDEITAWLETWGSEHEMEAPPCHE